MQFPGRIRELGHRHAKRVHGCRRVVHIGPVIERVVPCRAAHSHAHVLVSDIQFGQQIETIGNKTGIEIPVAIVAVDIGEQDGGWSGDAAGSAVLDRIIPTYLRLCSGINFKGLHSGRNACRNRCRNGHRDRALRFQTGTSQVHFSVLTGIPGTWKVSRLAPSFCNKKTVSADNNTCAPSRLQRSMKASRMLMPDWNLRGEKTRIPVAMANVMPVSSTARTDNIATFTLMFNAAINASQRAVVRISSKMAHNSATVQQSTFAITQ